MAFTRQDVEDILALLDASPFEALDLEIDNLKLSVRRSAGAALPVPVAAPASQGSADLLPAAPVADDLVSVRAPMVGTFYRAAKPGAPPFIDSGATVEPETIIGIIEVMKLMNPIPAGIEGIVVEVLVGDGQFVEYGQPLVRVRPGAALDAG